MLVLQKGAKWDVVAALNFSAFLFHKRSMLLKYFAAARAALKKVELGLFALYAMFTLLFL
jgi:hypothetical protein